MVFVAAALAVPLLGSDPQPVSEQVSRWVIWSGLAMATSMLIVKQRLERAALLERGEEAQHLARADPLTGLGNRRAFDEAFGAASSRAVRTERSLSVIIADVEAFKAVNDVYRPRCRRSPAARGRDDARRGRARARCLLPLGWGRVRRARRHRRRRRRRAGPPARRRDQRNCSRPDGQPVKLHVGVAQLDPGHERPRRDPRCREPGDEARAPITRLGLRRPAGVAEWQTRSTQNRLSERTCGFESHLRYRPGQARWWPVVVGRYRPRPCADGSR